jgi:hypothetical protein
MSEIPEAYKDLSEYDNRAYAYGLNNGQTDPFFSYIKIFLLNRRRYSSVTLINPIITEWAHSQLDQTNGNKLLDAKMTVAYEAVYYDTKNTPVSKTEPGFNSIHYDNAPSPLSVLGGGGKGISGLLNGSADILGVFNKEGPLSVGDWLNVAISTKNLAQNAKSLTKAGIKQEAYSLVTSSLIRGATNPASSTISQIDLDRSTPDQIVTKQVNPVNTLFRKIGSESVSLATPRNLGGTN